MGDHITFVKQCKVKHCEYCGKIFIPVRKERKFCSIECKNNSLRNKTRPNNMTTLISKQCKYCNNYFTTRRHTQKFCNSKCMKNYNNTYLNEKVCPTCKEIFKPKRRKQQFCSIKCSKPRKNKYYINICISCNKEFEARSLEDKRCNECRIKIKNSGKCSKWHGKWCLYNDIKIHGTYELRTCNILDKLKEQNKIYKWEYTKDKIRYFGLDNKYHYYLIDFKVFINEVDFYYLEVKGIKRKNDDIKWETTRKSGFDLKVWFLRDIEEFEHNLNISNNNIKELLKKGILNKEVNIIWQET